MARTAERHGDTAAIVGRGMQDRPSARCPPAQRQRLAARRLPRASVAVSALGHHVEPQRRRGRGADADAPRGCSGRPRSSAICAAADDEGEIALPRVDLVEARRRPAAPATPGNRTSVRQAASGSAVTIGPRKKSAAAISLFAAAVATDQRRAERHRDQHDLGRRVAVGERAADGAARPRRGMADKGQRLGQQRQLGPHQRIVLDNVLLGRRADGDRVALVADIGKAGNARDVDQPASAAPAASPSAAPASGRRR